MILGNGATVDAGAGGDTTRADDDGPADTAIADAPAAPADAPPLIDLRAPLPDAAEPSAAESRYVALLADETAAQAARWTECLGFPADQLAPVDDDAQLTFELAQSLRRGLVVVDEASAAACLAALRTLSCQRIVEMYQRGGLSDEEVGIPVCSHFLTGKVALGGNCLSWEDCGYPGRKVVCERSATCGDTCQAQQSVPALGENAQCGSVPGTCPAGTRCRLDPGVAKDRLVCARPALEGGFCQEALDCALGLGCAYAGEAVLTGICRVIGPGAPCAGTWECGAGYICTGVTAGTKGTCRIGKPAGDRCAIQGEDVNHVPYSDCAPLLECLDLDGEGSHCMGGGHPGDPCGEVKAPAGMNRECLGGTCVRGARTRGICVAHKPPGAVCTTAEECPSGGGCRSDAAGEPARCLRPYVASLPVGAPCALGVTDCAPEAYCAAPPGEYGPAELPENCSCKALLKVGEACRPEWDRCEPLADCIQGVCRRC